MSWWLSADERKALRRIYRMLRINPGQFMLALLFGVLCLGSSVALSGVSAWLIARASQMPPVLSLEVAAVGVRTFGVTRAVTRYLQRLFSHRVALNGMDALRLNVYDSLAKGPIEQVAKIQRGDLLARVGHDIDEAGNLVVRSLLPIATAIIVSGGTVVAVACLSPQVALALLACLLVSGLVAPAVTAVSARRTESVKRRQRTELAVATMEILDGADELRVAGRYGIQRDKTNRIATDLERAKGRADRPAAIAIAIDNLAMGVSVVAALLIAIPQTTSGMVAAVALAVLVLLPLSSFESVSEVSSAAIQLIRSAQAAKRISDLLGPESKIEEAEQKEARAVARESAALEAESSEVGASDPGSIDGAVPATDSLDREVDAASSAATESTALDSTATPTMRAENLAVGWPEGPAVAKGFDLQLEPGKLIGIVGPSGVGKTTLLYTLAGMLPAKEGAATLNGVDTWEMSRANLTRQVQLTTEDAHVFATSVYENMRVADAGLDVDTAHQLLEKVGLAQWLEQLPEGIDTLLGTNNTSISGGEKRRLLMARALASPAPLLLLDEPTEHLDPDNADALMRLLAEEAEAGRGLLVVTHRLSILRYADQVISVEAAAEPGGRARVTASGSYAELLASNEAFKWAVAQEG